MSNCKEIDTPMEVNAKFSIEDISPLAHIGSYKKLVGSLIYLCNTRPNIAYFVGVLSRFSNKLPK